VRALGSGVVMGGRRQLPSERVPADLHERLLARRGEIEQAVLARVYGVSDPASVDDPGYVAGLRAAVSAALSCGIDAIAGDHHPPPMPPELSFQARYAARTGVCLETVLRRYFAGYALLCDFIVEEVEERGMPQGVELQRVLRAQAALLDRWVIDVTAEYTREAEGRFRQSTEHRRLERVRSLLAGELVDGAELGYALDAWHIGVVVIGPGARAAIRDLAASLDRNLLAVRPEDGSIWTWLGGRSRIAVDEVIDRASEGLSAALSLVFGEPAHGLDGWRLTHQQASAAVPVALHSSQKLVRYADVALVASVLRDDTLSSSLHELYLAPLATEPDGGENLRRTLRTYFETDRNTSSTAAALGVSRKTVTSRLRGVEQRLSRPLGGVAVELEIALRLEEVKRAAST